MSEPTTEAGIALVLRLQARGVVGFSADIAAIEAEARADVLAGLTPALHEWLCGSGAYPKHPSKRPAIGWPCERSAAAVRAILAEQQDAATDEAEREWTKPLPKVP